MKYAVDFTGWVTIEAKSSEDAQNLFWEWVGSIEDNTLIDWHGTITKRPVFEYDGAEEDD